MKIETQNLIDYYVNTLIIQYNDLPNAKATIATLVEQALCDGIFSDIRDGFNIDTAVGVQLDIIGKYVGIDRFYKAQQLSGFFSFLRYSEVASPPIEKIGFTRYGLWITHTTALLTGATTVSNGAWNLAELNGYYDYSFDAIITGTGALTATVEIEVSNDGINPITLGTITLAGTDTATDGFNSSVAWKYWRAVVTNITGTSASIDVTWNRTSFDKVNKLGKFLTYNSALPATYRLNDDLYRIAIKMQIIKNNSNFSHKDIDDNAFKYGYYRASSNNNMKMSFFVNAVNDGFIDIIIQKNLLPLPMGVGLEAVIRHTKPKIFGFARYNKTISPFITGFTRYSNYGIKEGEVLTYSKTTI
jgi:hypothetical protein